ncbi:MAG: hypothetical protein AVDCRST_MAG59-289 [uncultured Thermomicrobiales bacterium]|uniref:Uncharacterized protein n=1 Tax=uncultured Thermomicrobiales bacterium TaxID=1645740 RepID=A0A6J4TZ11_9BACT|nr:MAG: hypothetical protein AVDCRST_MAG59-289 [uncultured Thermomicrobiales bacterium]
MFLHRRSLVAAASAVAAALTRPLARVLAAEPKPPLAFLHFAVTGISPR